MSDAGTDIIAEQRDGAYIVAPQADVDMSFSPKLRESLRNAQSAGPERVVVDLTNVHYMDSSGLATLIEAMKNSRAAKTRLILCGMSDKVRAIFEIARLNQYFTIADDLDSALSA